MIGRETYVVGVGDNTRQQAQRPGRRQAVQPLDQVADLEVGIALGQVVGRGAAGGAVQRRRGEHAGEGVGRVFVGKADLDLIAQQRLNLLSDDDVARFGVALGLFSAVDGVAGGDVGHHLRRADVGGEIRPGGQAALDAQGAGLASGLDSGKAGLLHHLLHGQRRLDGAEGAGRQLLVALAGENAQQRVAAELDQVAAVVEQDADQLGEQAVDEGRDRLRRPVCPGA